MALVDQSTGEVVGISGAMDYVITPEGKQFSCEHGIPLLGVSFLSPHLSSNGPGDIDLVRAKAGGLF